MELKENVKYRSTAIKSECTNLPSSRVVTEMSSLYGPTPYLVMPATLKEYM